MSNVAFPQQVEVRAASIASDIVRDIKWLLDILMPNGLPYGKEKETERAQVEQYLKDGWQSDPEFVKQWIRNKTSEIQKTLSGFGVPPDKIAAAHPYNIAEYAAIAHSYKMERLIGKYSQPITADMYMATEVPNGEPV